MSSVLPKDSISRFMNWFNNLGKDKPLVNRANGSPDIFSKFMNRISN
ncbi:ferredoxin--nitrite reductase [Prochlorococcus marinus XMU1408]|uniref:Ferredoxin--nitrite reductase n=1 Tax=Prochlorococcus marinus XMU1408 TaxID=2213228 RepID=A0A318QW98_PROMR|nr:ferredoxin--nitrite reductase [Prochlorococcus marinus XMU1408]